MIEYDSLIRFAAFFSVLLLLFVGEYYFPRRSADANLWQRRINNLALIALSVILVQLLLPLLALIGLAALLDKYELGLFNQVALPASIEIVLSIIVLDLAVYWQHRWSHRFDILWRLHRVHHTDRHIDVTTGIRFHPFEILLSLAWKSVVVMLIGAPVIAALLFELLLNLLPMFNHSNLKLPQPVDRVLRRIVVTPDMHRVHHSQWQPETDSNYCFFLPWWDHLFSSYRDQPEQGHTAMQIGLADFSGAETTDLRQLLLTPFRRKPQ